MGIGVGELIVTTVRGPSELERELAQRVALRMGSRLCSRGKISIPTLIQRRAAAAAVVVKDPAPGEFLKEMGVPVISDTKRVWYGRLPAR